MRLIGHLENEARATVFGDFLTAKGVKNRLEEERDGSWAVWVFEEDEISRAKEMLSEFRLHPDERRYFDASRAAASRREQERAEAEAAHKRFYDRQRLFRTGGIGGSGKLTLGLIVVSVIVTLFTDWGSRSSLLLLYMPAVLDGQVWRLITPIFIHMTVLHLLFDMMWLYDLGNMVEGHQGIKVLGPLVVVLAVTSNCAQYYFVGPAFGGMSGVVYGLLGYIWIRGKFDPFSGLFLHPQVVLFMVIWFFLGVFGILGGIANWVHGVGLGVGMLWGFVSAQLRR